MSDVARGNVLLGGPIVRAPHTHPGSGGGQQSAMHNIYIYIHTHTYCSVAGRRISYYVATLSYDNYYTNLRDYGNSLVSDLL